VGDAAMSKPEVLIVSDGDALPGFTSVPPVLPHDRVVGYSETPTVCIDLSKASEEIHSPMSGSYRFKLHQSVRRGYITLLDSDGDYLHQLAAMCRKNMERLGARFCNFYFFAHAYFDDLRSQLAIRVVLKDGVLVGGALFTGVGEWIECHLSAAKGDHRGNGPALIAIDSGRRWGQDDGFRWLQLGGGVTSDSNGDFPSYLVRDAGGLE
jgi:hypothetical protein